MKKIKIKFWGVRGSLATPGKDTLTYGGNTPCVEIRYGDELFILDTGTGIFNLGKELERQKVTATILYSHYHWDHLLGLPFFSPIYNDKNEFTIIGRTGLKEALNNFLKAPNFPVKLSDFGSQIRLQEKEESSFNIGGVEIEAFDVNHPNGAFGYRFTFGANQSVVFISDNSPDKDDTRLINNIMDADILIHDAQYLPEEYIRKRRFGHSSFFYVLDIAKKANVKNVILFHHDPSRTDKQLGIMEKTGQKLGKKIGVVGKILAAREGMEIEIKS